ncbi:hypothetical protein [Nitratireductor aquibiodomus]|uniref:hypothetical protein n=1 Tax=Nitratireductor aquibiodomus TaxID=204799 RepID=UPI001FCA4F3D|nr:hypothetical protein [Nitratireductor aquibiodomus]
MAAMNAMGIDRSTPPTVARMAIFRLSRNPSIKSPLRSKLGGNAPLKMRAARVMPCEMRSQFIGSMKKAQPI